MDDRHLRQAEHHHQRDGARQCIAENDRRAGGADGNAAAHEEAGANGAPEADHDDLCLRKPAVQAAFAFADGGYIHKVSGPVLGPAAFRVRDRARVQAGIERYSKFAGDCYADCARLYSQQRVRILRRS